MKPRYGKPETVYSNAHQEVYRVEAAGDGVSKSLYVTNYGMRAAVVVEGPQGILLTRQYRYVIDALSWEIPGGKADKDETAEQAAIRECFEETGIRCRTVQPLIVFHPGLDTLRNPTHIFRTSDFEILSSRPSHGGEVAETVWIPLAECLSMIAEGKIVDSLSLIALLSYSRTRESS